MPGVACQFAGMGSYSVFEYAPSALLRVTDEDAADFLQSQFSNDLRPFEPGGCTYGLFLDAKGKVLGDAFVLCRGPEDFLVFSPASDGAVIRKTLEQHIIADDVVLGQPAAHGAAALIGEGGEEALRQTGAKLPGPGGYGGTEGLICIRGRRAAEPAFECVALDADAAATLKELTGAGDPVSESWVQKRRLRAGYPLVPFEAGPADLPGECGLEKDAISFTKGCYLGQEAVARMHNVGRARRGLFRVEGAGDAPGSPQDLLNESGKVVGELRSAYAVDGGWIGAAMVKLRHLDSGAGLAGANFGLRIAGPLGEGAPGDA